MCLFKLIEENQIRQTNALYEVFFGWISRLAGFDEAMNVVGWCELCHYGEVYYGDNFKVIVEEI